MSTIKKALSKIVHARGSKTPTGAETPTRSSTHDESITEVDDTNADGETAAQRQQRVESINSKRSKSLARSRDQTPLTRFKSPDVHVARVGQRVTLVQDATRVRSDLEDVAAAAPVGCLSRRSGSRGRRRRLRRTRRRPRLARSAWRPRGPRYVHASIAYVHSVLILFCLGSPQAQLWGLPDEPIAGACRLVLP
jgi:hypothetical protein